MAAGDHERIEALSLQQLRSILFRQEETIIFSLIERAQFSLNPKIYEAGGLPTPLSSASFLDFFFSETEKLHSLVRRYTAPEEHPFYPHVLQTPVLPSLSAMTLRMRPNTINFNAQLMTTYIQRILPLITRPGDDSQYGSSATADIAALQALSQRVHYGKQVAEAKFQAHRELYSTLILQGDTVGLMNLLTDEAVEKQVLERVRLKASTYGQGVAYMKAASSSSSSSSPPGSASSTTAPPSSDGKLIDAERIVEIYRDFVIPLTKDVEVQYLLQRLGGVPVCYLGPSATFTHQATLKAFSGRSVELLPQGSVHEVISSVQTCKAVYGVIPYMNSGTGFVAATQAVLTSFANAPPDTAVQIVDEVYLPVEQTLLVNACADAARLSDIKRLYSHPQAISQCRRFLAVSLPHVEIVESASTAAAGQICAAQNEPCAAIGSDLLAEAYDLRIIERSIQDAPKGSNVTRFLVVSKRQSYPTPTGTDSSLILFGVADEPGALCRVLGLFSDAGINLQSIEAFKNPKIMWEMNFCVELHSHLGSPAMAGFVERLRKLASFVVTLGSWPRRPQPTSL